MKSLICSLVFILVVSFSYGQTYPIQQNLGSSSTLVQNPNYGGFKGGLVPYSFLDTSAANTALTFLKNYDGAIIKTTSPINAIWYRKLSTNEWIQVSSGSSSSVNIYNSDGTLSGNRTVTGANFNLLFSGINGFTAEGNTISLQGGNQFLHIVGDTANFDKRVSYSTDIDHNAFTDHTLVDKDYVDNAVYPFDATVSFSVNADPNTVGTTFNPNTPQLDTKVYVSTIDGSLWTWNGVAYVIYTSVNWGIFGNAGTTAGTNFIGTTDNVDLMVKRNSVEVGLFGSEKLRVNDLNKTNGYEFGSSLSQAQPSSSVSSSIWTQQSISVRADWWDGVSVASNHDTLFVLGGWRTGPTVTDSISYSVDAGVTWFGYTGALPFAVHSFAFVRSPDGWFYVLGGDAYSTTTQQKSVYRSRDFVNWTLMTSDYGGGVRILGSAWADDFGNIYWAGGQSGINSGGLNDIWKSTNGGTTWTQVASGISVGGNSFLGQNISNTGVYFNGRIYIVGGGVYDEATPANFTYTKKVYSAALADLTKWKAENDLPFLGGRQYNSVSVWDGKIWSVGGYNGVANVDSVGYMNAAGTWTLFTAPVGTNPSASHAAGLGVHNDRLFYVMGNTTNKCFMLSRSNDLFIGDQVISGNLVGSGTRMTYAEAGGNIEAANTIPLAVPLQLGTGTMVYPSATGFSSYSATAAANNGLNITNTSSTGYMQSLLAQSSTNFGGMFRWNSGYGGNYTGTSLPFANSVQVLSGSGNNQPLVLSANPIIGNTGTSSGNAAFRMDNVGLKIGTNATIHTAGTQALDVTGNGLFTGTVNAARALSKQGADIASTAGAMTLGTDGTSFEITGTNTITLLSNVGWANGNEVTLMFTGAATLTDGTANSGTDIGMELAANANFVASAGATIKLILSEIGGTQRWREVSRSVN